MLKLYQVEWCPQCHRVRQLLTELGLSYTAVNVAEDPAERDDVVAVSDQNTVPVLVDGDKVVAGSEDIAAYLTATYPPAADAEAHAIHGAWRAVTLTGLDPETALEQLQDLLRQNGFSIVSQVTGPQINERLPDSYVLLQAAVPIAALEGHRDRPHGGVGRAAAAGRGARAGRQRHRGRRPRGSGVAVRLTGAAQGAVHGQEAAGRRVRRVGGSLTVRCAFGAPHFVCYGH